MLVARLRQLTDPAVIATGLLERFSLTDAADRKVSTYSGGMRRRLDVAMSLIGNPPVIFLDEPTTGLDPRARIEVWQAVEELARQGTTVLLTTPYLDEAEQLADRIAILHEGRIIADATLADLERLLPPVEVEYVERQPTLEDVFLAVVGDSHHSPTTLEESRGAPTTSATPPSSPAAPCGTAGAASVCAAATSAAAVAIRTAKGRAVRHVGVCDEATA